jgi:hypothetical protein
MCASALWALRYPTLTAGHCFKAVPPAGGLLAQLGTAAEAAVDAVLAGAGRLMGQEPVGPPGSKCMISLYLVILGATVVGMVLALRAPRGDQTPAPWCAVCGYSLYGHENPSVCPECGTVLGGGARLRWKRRFTATARLRCVVWSVLACVALGVTTQLLLETVVPCSVRAEKPYLLRKPSSQKYDEVSITRFGSFRMWPWGPPGSLPRADFAVAELMKIKQSKAVTVASLGVVYRGDTATAVRGFEIPLEIAAVDRWVHVEDLGCETVIAWMQRGRIDAANEAVKKEAVFLESILRGAVRELQPAYPSGPFNVRWGGTVSSHSFALWPETPMWFYAAMMGFGCVVVVWGVRYIRKRRGDFEPRDWPDAPKEPNAGHTGAVAHKKG